MKYFLPFFFLLGYTTNSLSQDTTKAKQEDPILDFADVEPYFPGGEDSLRKYIAVNTLYPEESLKNGEMGTVYVQFVVNSDGSISNAQIIKGVSPLLDAEALRVINSMPNWIPGQLGGRNIRVKYLIPIKFNPS